MRLSIRGDVPIAEVVFAAVYEGEAVVDVARMHTSLAHLRGMADAIYRTLGVQPSANEPQPRQQTKRSK